MSKSDWLIRVFVWLALLGYMPGAAYALTRPSGGRWDKIIRWIWTASGFCLLLHIAFALHFVHHWNQASVYVETARQTAAVFNINWGGGMYINYLLLALWMLELVWWWRWPDSYRRRPRWLTMMWQGFLLFIFFNATVVFVSGTLRWLGLSATIVLLWLWWQFDAAKLLKLGKKQTSV